MFEELSYYELEEWRDELLLEVAGKQDAEIELEWIESISQEMDRRESVAATRLRFLVVAVNLMVLAFILSSCTTTIRGTGQMISGIGQGTGTIVKGVGDYLQEEMEGK